MIKHIFNRFMQFLIDQPYKKDRLVSNRYRIIKLLGMGSYGISYLVMDETVNEYCVLKQMRKSRRKKSKISFEHEKKILSLLKHEQIPKLRNSFIEDGLYFIVMDFIEGKTFEDLIFLEGEKFDEIESLKFLQEILTILAYLHQLNIVHRDLRIPNVILKDNQLHVIDFGLARIIEEANNSDVIKGYDNEKQIRREVHVKSDFYALGHFLLFLLYSSYETEGKKEKSWEEELIISIEVKQIIRKLLQVDEPYTHVDEIIVDIDQLLNEENK